MVIPIGDRNPVSRTPWVLRLILAANFAAFFLWQPFTAEQCAQLGFFQQWAAIPSELAQGAPLNAAQVAASPFAACGLGATGDKFVFGAVLVSLFLHADVWHLLGNMLFLWIFGNNIEDRMGHAGFVLFYVVGGVISTAVFAAANSAATVPLIGASGAVAAVLGAYIALFPLARVTVIIPPLFFLPFSLPAFLVLGGWFLLQLRDVSGPVAGGGVAYLAHVAGFVAGMAVILLLRLRRGRRRPPRGPEVRSRSARRRRRGGPHRSPPHWGQA